ncbi:Cytochrome P450 protein [Actinoplanes sp. SE50]|uniref:cytochrome P450 n=1 Tax=unclassified Actinoplanes TaxID=2626549 RepID=UPI00023EC5C1|nr:MULTISPECIES: cytochrome P450 [unclassified Actinoplanes]AEV83082.1 Cytochrome P450 protein [Actinoplanes sp. SE50/110]ATO81478.1 Cytochrome P450 protein [Actinoplanes sp. SE50]SLL98885.1 cytochrome P450 protein [Actinoplanes sp. SE50/110]
MTTAPPVPANLSRAGLIQEYDRDRLGFVMDAVRRFGPVTELSPGTVLVADGEVAHDVLRRTNRDFLMDRDRAWRPTGSRRGEDALESWMSARRAMLSALSGGLVAEHLSWYSGELTGLLDAWAARGGTGDPLTPLVRLSTDAFLRLCAGPSSRGADRREPAAAVAGLLDSLTPIVGSSYELPWFLDRLTPRRRRAVRAQHRLAESLGALVDRAPSGGLVAALRDAGVPREPLVRILISATIAGRLVPAAATAWTLRALAVHQPDDEPAHIVDEVLRLWPPTWLIHRTTHGEEISGDWRFPARTAVMICPYAIHRDERHFPDPAAFRPARWRDGRLPAGAYLPFGGGPRWCVGTHLAKAQLVEAVRVFRRYRLTDTSDAVTLDTRSTLYPRGLALGVGRPA